MENTVRALHRLAMFLLFKSFYQRTLYTFTIELLQFLLFLELKYLQLQDAFLSK